MMSTPRSPVFGRNKAYPYTHPQPCGSPLRKHTTRTQRFWSPGLQLRHPQPTGAWSLWSPTNAPRTKGLEAGRGWDPRTRLGPDVCPPVSPEVPGEKAKAAFRAAPVTPELPPLMPRAGAVPAQPGATASLDPPGRGKGINKILIFTTQQPFLLCIRLIPEVLPDPQEPAKASGTR